MNKKLFLIHFDLSSDVPNIYELPITKETAKQYQLGANPLYLRLINKVYIDTNRCFRAMTTSARHIIVEGEENVPKALDILMDNIQQDIKQLELSLERMNLQQKYLKDLTKTWEVHHEK